MIVPAPNLLPLVTPLTPCTVLHQMLLWITGLLQEVTGLRRWAPSHSTGCLTPAARSSLKQPGAAKPCLACLVFQVGTCSHYHSHCWGKAHYKTEIHGLTMPWVSRACYKQPVSSTLGPSCFLSSTEPWSRFKTAIAGV